ncbi:RNA polymerase sigma factor [Sorangium sp. So ce1151]|uniref:RNA polymerase sigma factor n=1 Tax=Sorangium sp. So ce1151 TaxID=3133332 RepID=UPI003F635065
MGSPEVLGGILAVLVLAGTLIGLLVLSVISDELRALPLGTDGASRSSKLDDHSAGASGSGTSTEEGTQDSIAEPKAEPLTPQQAFEILFKSQDTYGKLLGWLTKLAVNRSDREDVAQSVLLGALENFQSYNPERAKPERWLNRIAVYTAAHYHEKAHLRKEVLTGDGPDIEFTDEDQSTEAALAGNQERMFVLEVFQSIDLELRSVLVAHDIHGIPMKEIAEKRGIPLSTAYKWRARAIERFREIAEERYRQEGRLARLAFATGRGR